MIQYQPTKNSVFFAVFLFILFAVKGFSATYFSQGTGNFSTLALWNTNAGGGGTLPVAADLSSGLHTFIVQAGHVVTVDQNITLAAVTINGTLQVGNNTTARTIGINGATSIGASGTFSCNAANASHQITFLGNISNSGTIAFYNSTTSNIASTFNGSNLSISGTGTFGFGNFTLAATTTTLVTLNAQVSILGAVNLGNNCTLNDGGLTHFVSGDWSETGNAQLTGNGTIELNSVASLQNISSAAAIAFNNLRLNLSGGTALFLGSVTIGGDLTLINSSTAAMYNGANHTINGDISVDASSLLDHTSGTLTFSASTRTQVIPSVNCNYNNLTFSNGGLAFPKTLDGNVTVNGTLTINAGSQVNATGNITVRNGINQNGTCNFTGSINFQGTGQTVSSTQSNPNLGTAALVSNLSGSLTFSFSAPATSTNWSVNNDFTVNSGNVILSASTTVTGQSGFSFSLNNNAMLYCRGTNNFPLGFGFVNIAPTTTVYYDSNIPQVVRGGFSYGSLWIGSNTKTMSADINVAGTFTLGSNVTANFLGFNLSVQGDINNGSGCTLLNDQTLFLNATDANQTINGPGSFVLQNVTITSAIATAPRTRTFTTALVVKGILSMTNPGGTSINTLTVDVLANAVTNNNTGTFFLGDFVIYNTSGLNNFRSTILSFGTRTLTSQSTVRYSNATANAVQLISNDVVYGNLDIAGSGTCYKSACGNLTLAGSFSRSSGNTIFRDSSFSIVISGDYYLPATAYTNPSAASTITFSGDFQNIGFGGNDVNLPNVVFGGTGSKQCISNTGTTVNVFGNLSINNGVTVVAGDKNLNIRGNFSNAGTGVFNQTSGTTTFSGSTLPQSVSTNTASVFGNITINKPAALAANRIVTFLNETNILGSVVFTANAAQLDAPGVILNIGGNWTFNTGCVFTPTNGTLNFNGTGSTQNITNNIAITCNHLVFSGSAAKSLGGTNLSITGDVTITGAILQGNNILINCAGNWTNNGSFTHSSTVTLNGNNQSLGGINSSFNNLTAAGTGTKTINSATFVNGAFTINSGVTFDVTASNNTLSVGGNYSNAGTINLYTSTVNFTGGAKTINSGGTGAGKRFYNVIFNATAGTAQTISASDFAVSNDLTVNSGNLTHSVQNILVSGNMVVNDLFTGTGAGTLSLNASSGNKIFNPGVGGSSYGSITVNAPSATYTLTGNDLFLAASRNLNVNGGRLNMGGRSITLASGSVTVNTGGTFHVDAGADLYLVNTASLTNSGGTLMLVGSPTNYAFLRRYGATSGFTINQTSGTLQARYYVIENSGTFTISGTTVIDAANNLSNGIFIGGTGSQYLNLTGYTFSNFTVYNVQFNTGPTNNVRRTSGTGIITFRGANGSLAGASFENDDLSATTGLIRWTSLAKRWTGAAGDNNWNTANNWNPNIIPDATDTVYLDHTTIPLATAYTVNINTLDAVAARLIIDRQTGTGGITLVVGAGRSLSVAENVNVLSNCILTQTNNTSLVNIGGSLVVTGTLNNGSSTINFNGSSGYSTISVGASSFFNLTISGNSSYSLGGNTTIQNTLNMTAGILDVSTANYSLTVQGDMLLTAPAVFVPQAGTVTFSRAGNQTISASPFNNFITSGSGIKTIGSNVNMVNVTIGAGTSIDAGNNVLFVSGNWTNNSGTTAFSQGTSGLLQFNGSSGTQNIDNGTASSTFSNVLMIGAALKTLARSCTVNGDLTIGAGCGNVNLGTFQITGTATKTFSVLAANTITIGGASNFPSGFGTVSIASTNTVLYTCAGGTNQNIFPTTYGTLSLTVSSNPTSSKILTGDVTIAGDLVINDTRTRLNATNLTITLTGNFSIPNNGNPILWGTSGTMIHNGGNWNIDVDYSFNNAGTPEFNNLTLTGAGTKTMLANLNISGNVQIQNNITLTMGTNTLIGAATKTFTMQDGAWLNCAGTGAVAFPTGFTTYSLNANSTVNLNASGNTTQTISRTPTYGNLILNNGTGTINMEATGNLNIAGNFFTNNSTLNDNSRNILCAGATIDIRNYTPSAGTTITLNGSTQNIVDNVAGATLDLRNIVFSNSGTKTIASGQSNTININGNVTIAAGVTVTCTNRQINFSGTTFTNSGTFNHLNTAGMTNGLNFTGANTQTINLGTNVIEHTVTFSKSNTNATTFTTANGNFTQNNGNTPTFVINANNVVNMGALTHTINGSISSSGTFNTASTNFNFTGSTQVITVNGGFVANNIVLGGIGTKTLGSNWTIADLTINSSSVLNTSASNYNITCTGNWTNNGSFTANSSTVSFESNNTSSRTITAGTSAFNNVNFNSAQTSARTYTLASPSTTISRNLTMNNGATLSLGGNVLVLGSNNSFTETHTINSGATLRVNSGSTLSFNNDNGTSTLNVNSGGILEAIGNNLLPARIGRSTATGRHQINLLSGSTIRARYYNFDYLSDAGMNIASGANVDATNNLSNGTWSNINTAGGTAKYYLVLNATVSTAIQDIIFNFTGTPIVGVHFNVSRTTTTSNIQFNEVVSGQLGGFQYESDALGGPSATSGCIRWPVTQNITWTGALNTDWNVAGNWSPAQVPTVFDNAFIPSVANNPRITSANAVCKNLTITTGNLSLQNGFTLTVSNDLINSGTLTVLHANSDINVGGSWTNNSTFLAGTGTVNFTGLSGYFTVTPGSSAFNHVNLNGSSSIFAFTASSITFNGNLTINSCSFLPNTSNYNYSFKGNFINNGTFNTLTTGTAAFNGNTAQTISNGTFSNMSCSGNNTKTSNGSLLVNGTLTVNSGTTLAAGAGSIWDLRGNVTLSAGSFYDDGGNAHLFSGNTWTGAGTCISDTGAIRFLLNGTQTIAGGQFNGLTFETGGAKILSGNVVTNGDVYVASGTSYLNLQTFTLNSIDPTAIFSAAANTNLYIKGANNCPSNFAAYDFDISSNTYYDAALNQTIGGITYGNLILNSAFTKTLGENTTVLNNLTFNNSTLDCSVNNYTLIVGGIYNNNSTGSFIANQGEVIFNGNNSAVQFIYNGGSGIKSFYNLTVNKLSGLVAQLNNGNPAILNALQVFGGSLDINGNTISLGSTIEVAAGASILTSGTFVLTGTGSSPTIRTSGSILNNLTMNAGSTVYTALDGVTINGNFIQNSGTFNGNGQVINLGSNGNAISIYGNYLVGMGGKLGLGNNATCTVYPGGSIDIVGDSVNLAVVSNNNSGGRYNFVVNGNIAAKNYLFEYMSASGILISATGTIDAANNLSNGTFTNGISNGRYLIINNTQTLTINNITFPVNPGGSSRNVYKNALSGTITFNNYFGSFAGAAFEDDPNSLIDWIGSVTLTWNGSISNNWNTAANWTASAGAAIVPTGAEDVVIPVTLNQPLISLDGATTNRLTINTGATLTINTPFASAPDFTILGDLQLNGVLVSTGSRDTINVKGNWSKSAAGNFISGASRVVFNAGAGTKNINNGTSTFNDFEIDGPVTYQLGSNTLINGNVNIKQGILDVTATNYNITLAGNWTNASTFTPRSGTVIFSTSSNAVAIDNGASRFFNLTCNGAATTVFTVTNNDLRTSGNTNINSGTLFLNNRTFFNGDNIGVDALSISGTFDMGSGGTLLNGNNVNIIVNNGGVFKSVGSSASAVVSISRQSTGSFSFQVNSGGTLQAKYYQFAYLNAAGLQMKSGSVIHPTNNLSDGNFLNGAAGGAYITLENTFSDFTVDSVSFGTGPNYNVIRIIGIGVITFADASGARSGALFENDDLSATTGLIRWSFTNPTLTWAGTTDSEWSTASNWTTSLGGPASNPPSTNVSVIIPDVSSASGNFPIIKTSTGAAVCSNMDIYSGGILNFQQGQSLTVNGTLNNQGTINSVSSASTLTIGNLWNNSGTFNSGTSTVVLAANSGTKLITAGNAAISFYNLTINGNAIFQTTGNLTIANNFTISAGTFTVATSSHLLTIGGNYSNNGTFNHGSGIIVFNKVSGTQTISGSATQTFFICRLTTTSLSLTKTLQLNCNLNINSNLDIQNARCILNGSTFTINIKGTWNNLGTFQSTGTGTVVFSGTSTQTISRAGAIGETFNHLTNSTTGGIQLLSTVSVAGNLVFASGASQIDLNTRTLNLTGSNTSIQLPGTACQFIGGSGSTINIQTGPKSINAAAGGSITFNSNVLVNLQNSLNFGANLSTIKGTLELSSGGSVNTNPPIYFNGSILAYSSGAAIGRGTEWSSTSGAGYPFHVNINAVNTVLDLSNGGSALRQMAGNLTLTNNSQLRMNAMLHALNVRGNISVASGCALVLGTLAGGDLQTGGNISVAAGSITLNSREVICNGSTGQTINGISTYSTLTVNNSASPVTLLSNIAISSRLRLVSGSLNTNGFTVTMQNFAEISRESVTATISSSPVVVSPDQYSVSYSASMTSGSEWTSQSSIRDVSVSGAGSILTLNSSRSINRSLNLLSGAGMNLNGQTLTLLNNGAGTFSGSIFVSGNSTISNAAGLGTGGLLVTSNQSGANPNNFSKQVLNNSGTGSLTIAASVTMTLSDGLFDFGAASGTPITTMNGVLQIGAGARVTNNACVYGTGSTLRFSSGNSFTVNAADFTWASGSITSGTAGIPWNVEINDAGTVLTLNQPRAVRNNLLINFGTLTLNYLSNAAFSVGGNWTRNGVTSSFNNPFDRKVSFEKSTAGNQLISTGSGITAEAFYDLVVNHTGGGNVQANCDLTVADTLAFTSGKLQLAAGSLMTIGSPFTNGNIAGCNASRYIVTWNGTETANIQHYTNTNTTYNFAIGDNSNYTPIILTLTNGAVPGSTITGTMRPQAHPNLGTSANFLNRYWSLDQSGLADGFLYTVNFVYADEDVTGSESLLMPFKYHTGSGVGSGWVGAGGSSASYIVGTGSLNAATNTLHWENVNSFSDITGNGGGTPLPITLVSFEAKASSKTVQLNWSTLSEVNNDYFTIERSSDGVTVQEVARVKGAGNHNGLLSYSAEDESPLTGTSYYRLKQTDFNGNAEYTSWKAVSFLENTAKAMVTVFPNPFSGETIFLETNGFADNTVLNFSICDITGKLLIEGSFAAGKSALVNNIPVPQLTKGLYVLRISGSGVSETKSLLVE